MNRIPKYQAWSEADKKMYQVLTLHLDDQHSLGDVQVLVKEVVPAFFGASDIATKFFAFNEIALREYTGLKDCKGSDVFERDIIQTTYSFSKEQGKAQVVIEHLTCGIRWLFPQDPGDFGFKPLYDPDEDPDDSGALSWDLTTFEISGNIYEHPHLLSKDNTNDHQ